MWYAPIVAVSWSAIFTPGTYGCLRENTVMKAGDLWYCAWRLAHVHELSRPAASFAASWATGPHLGVGPTRDRA